MFGWTLLTFSATAALLGMATSSARSAPANDPGLGLTVQAVPRSVHPGDPVHVKVTVTNRLGAPLRDTSVAAPGAPDCRRASLGAVDPGGSISYTCSVTAVGARAGSPLLTATATADGKRLRARAEVPYQTIVPGYYGKPTPTWFFSLAPPVAQFPPSQTASPTSTNLAGASAVSPAGRLPLTGRRGDSTVLWVTAIGLLAGGGALVLLGNRRRREVLDRS
jgi:hypothetical protein